MWLKKARILKLAVLTGVFSWLSFMGIPASAQETSQNLLTQPPNLASPERAWELKWQFKSAGRSMNQGTDAKTQISNEQVFESKLNLDSQYWLSDDLFFDIEPSVRFQSGRLQALDGANKPSNGISFKQAAMQWLPSNSFWFSAGALNQADLHTNLVADELPFPGARVTLKQSISSWDFQLVAESSIPSNNQLDTGTTQVESVPSKNAAQVQVNWQPKSYLFSKNRIGYYSYQNLPSEVAEASSLIGNTTTRLNTDQWAFKYKYQGLEAGSDWQLPLTGKIDLLLQGAAAKNQGAPAEMNTGYSMYSGLRYLMSSKHDVTFGGRYFRVEPDTAPAFYSNYGNSRTNRVGYTAEALWHLKKQKFSIGAVYGEAQTIFLDPSQSKVRSFEIRLETDYASI